MRPVVFTILFSLATILFAFFPLTDTDIWWHLASARDFIENGPTESDPFCWTPSRFPWINVHLYFQLAVHSVFSRFGSLGLVLFKSIAWGIVAFLWVLPVRRRVSLLGFSAVVGLAFVFRYALECRPVFASMLFLGIFWNLLPEFERRFSARYFLSAVSLLVAEWLWVRTQGLFTLGFAMSFLWLTLSWKRLPKKQKWGSVIFFFTLLTVPLWHSQGFFLWRYPFGLLDRLVGGSSSSQIFSREIAENRSPLTLLFHGENEFATLVLLFAVLVSAVFLLRHFRVKFSFRSAWLLAVCVLAVIAERNLALFLFPFVWLLWERILPSKPLSRFNRGGTLTGCFILAFTVGFFLRSVSAYIRDGSLVFVSPERVPVGAALFIRNHPLPEGYRIFHDDRSGGFLEWNVRGLKTYADGRFILKDSAFFANYLGYAQNPGKFFSNADSLRIGRVLLPVRYFTPWKNLAFAVAENPEWQIVYSDSLYVVMDRRNFNF